MSQLDLKNCTFKLKDGAAHEIEFKVGDGGANFRLRRNILPKRNRGKLDLIALGDEVPMEVSLEATIEEIKSLSTETQVSPYEFLTQRYAASAYTTVGNACEPYAINVEVFNDHTCGAEQDETTTFEEFRVDKIDGGIRDAVLKVTGRCNNTFPTAVRS